MDGCWRPEDEKKKFRHGRGKRLALDLGVSKWVATSTTVAALNSRGLWASQLSDHRTDPMDGKAIRQLLTMGRNHFR